MSESLLSVRDLSVTYRSRERIGRAVDGLSFDIAPGEALAVVGESGCGKSTVALSLLDLLPAGTVRQGEVLFGGRDLLRLPDKALYKVRGNEIGMVFQEPMTSLNPVYTVGNQICEVLLAHRRLSRQAARARALELLDRVAVPDPAGKFHAYPHELSGGQRQRVMIAMAVALSPKLLIADEPTTALDANTQAQVLSLLDRLRRELNMGMLLISHDLPLVQRWTDRIVVMHHGKAMETLPSSEIFGSERHAYTSGLTAASLRAGDTRHASTARLAEVYAFRQPGGEFEFKLHVPNTPPTPAVRASAEPLLKVEQLRVWYPGGSAPAVNEVSLSIARRETLGLVGESGSGKSSLSRAILGLIPSTGVVSIDGEPFGLQSAKKKRRRLQMVFQDPYASLNPRQTVAELLLGVLKLHGFADRQDRVATMLDRVRLPHTAANRYPHEFSGGQRQRIAIARALILEPDVLICDEPVSALDVSVQAQILNMLADLKQALGLSMLFISHDLSVVRYISDRVMVMQHGKIVETNDRTKIWTDPQHPYTRQLIDTAQDRSDRWVAVTG